MKQIQKLSITLFVGLFFQGTVLAQQSNVMHLDPEVRFGKLPNGFTYYIHKYDEAKGKIEMNLVIKAGSFFEDPDQIELAHLTEHMAFEGTKYFPGDSLMNYVTKNGLRFGNEMTAYTGEMRTAYVLSIPSGNARLFENSLQILRDWAQDFEFYPNRIDAQRGVVLGELRMRGNDYSSELRNISVDKIFYNNSKKNREYQSKRQQNLKNFKHESLLRFYKDWYRPDLEAVVIVGDIDIEETEASIKTLFSDLRRPDKVREVRDFSRAMTGKLSGKNRMIAITHPEQPEVELSIYKKRKGRSIYTATDYKHSILDDLFFELINSRFKSFSQAYNAPLIICYHNRNASQIDAMITSSRLKDERQIENTIKSMVRTFAQIELYGFTSEEVTKSKSGYLSTYQKRNKNRTSQALVRAYVDHFTYNSPAPSQEYEKKFITQLVDNISVDEINAHARKWISAKYDQDIVIVAPENKKPFLPDERTALKWLLQPRSQKVEPFCQPADIPDSLLYAKDLPQRGTGMAILGQWRKDTSVVILNFMNGPKVVLRPSDNSYETTFKCFSSRGSALYNDIDRPAAESAAGIVVNSGVGSLNKFQLNHYLSEKKVLVSPFITEHSSGINGFCSPQDIEEMLQLVYLYFTAPRKDEEAFKDWRFNKKREMEEAQVDIKRVFMTARGSGKRSLSLDDLNRVTLDNAFRIYNDLFSSANDFTFFVAGNFDVDQMKRLVFKYLDNIPRGVKIEKPVSNRELVSEENEFFFRGKVSKTLYLGNNAKADVCLYFPGTGKYSYTLRTNLTLDILSEVFRIRIFNRLRTKEGGTYTPSVSLSKSRISRDSGIYRFIVQFDTELNNYENMISYVMEEFKTLQQAGPDAETLAKAVGIVTNNLQMQVSNGIAAAQLMEIFENEDSSDNINKQLNLLKSITEGEMKKVAKCYLTEENFQRFILLPERVIK